MARFRQKEADAEQSAQSQQASSPRLNQQVSPTQNSPSQVSASGVSNEVNPSALQRAQEHDRSKNSSSDNRKSDLDSSGKGKPGNKKDKDSQGKEGTKEDAKVAAKGAIKGAKKGGLTGAAKGAAIESIKHKGRKLGAGGTSYAQDNDGGQTGAKLGAKAAIGAGAVGTPAAALAALLMAIRQLAMMMLALAKNLLSTIGLAIAMAAKAIWAFISAPFAAVFGALGGVIGAALGISATIATTVLSVATTAVALVVALNLFFSGALLGQDDLIVRKDPCSLNFTNKTTNDSGDGAGVGANQEANAKIIYSYLKSLHMSDVNIAGILGNWEAESGIDPYSVETVSSEPGQIGPAKQAVLNRVDHDYGIGLGQWTSGRNIMLRNYAKDKGKEWSDIYLQLAFFTAGDNPGDVAVFKGMITDSLGSPAKAAVHYHDKWERSADRSMDKRIAAAEKWAGLLSGWSVDSSVKSKVEDISGGLELDTASSSDSRSSGRQAASSMFRGIRSTFGRMFNQCRTDTGQRGSGGAPPAGGMDEAQAERMLDDYKSHGHADLMSYYHGSGPGMCKGDYVPNCVSFTWWFLRFKANYTGVHTGGNGGEVAAGFGPANGLPVSNTPEVYSVFSSYEWGGSIGHTGIVVGSDGDRILVAEAGYCEFRGRTRWIEKEKWQSQHWQFVPINKFMKQV